MEFVGQLYLYYLGLTGETLYLFYSPKTGETAQVMQYS